jgi:nicotinamide-nucleotide amidase
MPAELPEVRIGQILTERSLTLAVAESCTGGLLGHRLTDVPGSSLYFLGGIVAYSYDAKERLLGVQHNTLYDHGAVSEQTAREMAQGVRRALGSDIGVSVTGIAGPGGGMPDKPVGLTWIGISARDADVVQQFVWDSDRAGNKALSAETALEMVLDYLAASGTTASEGS